ncbi:MAG: response regulator transcription factor [Ignavibacteriaceae bacterium]|nr:response regulator transcription factor [Ignavibacteriaceae bacterium]
MKRIKILIVDDHFLVRTGIISLLRDVPEIEIIGEAENGKIAIEKCKQDMPDVVLMDISMPDMSGIEATKIIKTENSAINVLILTMHESEEYFYNTLKQGASGILNKNVSKDELVKAIVTVSIGKRYIGNSISEFMIDTLMQKFEEEFISKQKEEVILTKREKDILYFIANGFSNQDIADKLNISIRPVETHKSNLMQKLSLKSAAALSLYAFEKGYK